MSAPRDPWERREIERVLTDKMTVAYETYRLARRAYDLYVTELPSGAQGSDGTLVSGMARSAFQRQREALAAYQKALQEFTDFVVRGIVPKSNQENNP
jgi:hypothetical protein